MNAPVPDPVANQTSGSPRRRSRGLGWPIAMSAILAVTVAVNLYVFHLATDDPSFAVESDYYQKAVHWDDELAQRRLNAELGWQATTELATSAAGEAELRVHLADASGAPLEGASVRVEAFAINRASDVSTLTLAALGNPADGAYRSPFPESGMGRWELRLEATRGAQRFTAVNRVERAR